MPAPTIPSPPHCSGAKWRRKPLSTLVDGVLFVQLDGVALSVLRWAIQAGGVPTLTALGHLGRLCAPGVDGPVTLHDTRQPEFDQFKAQAEFDQMKARLRPNDDGVCDRSAASASRRWQSSSRHPGSPTCRVNEICDSNHSKDSRLRTLTS